MEFFIQLLISGLVIGSVYAMIALGFVLIYKSSRVINFAQGELLLVGAYFCLWLTVDLKIPFLASLGITLIASVTLGFAIERLFLRPMIGEPRPQGENSRPNLLGQDAKLQLAGLRSDRAGLYLQFRLPVCWTLAAEDDGLAVA